MTLAAGTKLSFYEVLTPLGAGAMGEVYRARDTRLDREVAIKVLPEHFADDAERLKRFEREAKTLASLNHPNVAQIFGVDQVGDTCFLVLELVPGESLEERLKRGPLPLDEAIDVGRQIAEGLEAAHEAGVIHRDLKPANVRLTPDGKVKVLDFGLAKPAREAGGSQSSTDSVLSTEAGRLLGTPTYMAPEQARGKSIDKRVDIWAFGCVLYECLTAKRAFAGETLTDVLGAVLHTEPDFARLPASTPTRVRELLADCLIKDPRERLRDLGDARRELMRLHHAPDESAMSAASRSQTRSWVLGALALIAASAAYFAGRANQPAVAKALTHLELPLAPAESLGPTSDSRPSRPAFAITSDGRHVVFTGTIAAADATSPSAPPTPGAQSASSAAPTALFVRALDAVEAVRIAGTEGADSVFLSHDDRWIGFFAEGEIKKVPLAGGPVARVAKLTDGGLPSSSPLVPADRDFFGACFDVDGSILFGRFSDGLWEVPAGGGAPKRLTEPALGDSHRLPHVLPGGRGILFTHERNRHPRLCFVSRRGGESRVLVEEATDGRFVAPDRILFASNGALLSAPFDLERAEVTGPATTLVSNLLHAYDGPRPGSEVLTAFFDVSASGTLVYATGGRIPIPASRLVWVARDGTVQPIATPSGYFARPRLSPDGRRVAVTYAAAGKRMLDARPTVFDLERGTMTRLSNEEGLWGTLWSSDGARIYSGSGMRGTGIVSMASDGTSQSADRIAGSVDGAPSSVSHDGAWLLQVGSMEGGGSDVLRIPLSGGSAAEPVIHTRANEAWAELSPDGELLAYGSDASGSFEVYVQPYPGPGPRQQVSVDGGNSPLWSKSGRELYFFQLVGGARGVVRVLAVDVEREPALVLGRPRELFTGRYQRLGGLTAFDVAPDDERFLMVEQSETIPTPTTRLRVVLDWLPEMRPLAAESARP